LTTELITMYSCARLIRFLTAKVVSEAQITRGLRLDFCTTQHFYKYGTSTSLYLTFLPFRFLALVVLERSTIPSCIMDVSAPTLSSFSFPLLLGLYRDRKIYYKNLSLDIWNVMKGPRRLGVNIPGINKSGIWWEYIITASGYRYNKP